MERSARLLFVTQVAPYSPKAPYHTAFGLAGAHGVLPQAWLALRQIADLVGLHPVLVEDVRELDDDAVAQARAVVLFTIGETPWSARQRTDLLDGVRGGGLALVVLHSALDACLGWDEYGILTGARFAGHPYTGPFVADVVDRTHPATAHLDATWPWVDELYTFGDLRADAEVLLRVPPDGVDLDVGEQAVPTSGFPLSWCVDEGNGRVFTTALGHFPAAWESNDYLAHVAGGLTWVMDAEVVGPRE